MKNKIKAILFHFVESIWSIFFRLSGFLRRRKSSELFTKFAVRGKNILIIAPHPDDETIGAGGAALLHRANGDSVTAIIITDGGNSRAGGFDREEMVKQRRHEMETAAGILGINAISLQLPEGSWNIDTAREVLLPHLETADIIYAPSCIDFHPEHLKVAQLLADVVKDSQQIRICELGVPLTSILVNCIIDISSVSARKDQALAAFETQRGAIFSLKRMSRYRAAFYRRPAVEIFRQLSGSAYRRMMKTGDWQTIANCPYTGVLPRPFLDFKTYFIGRSERKKLAEIE